MTLHSLMLIDFRPDTPPYNFEQFFAAASTTSVPRALDNPAGIPLVPKVPGNVNGPIVGGNLTSLTGTLGTPYEIDTRGKIVLLEEVHKPVNTVFQLRLAGKFRDCLGIVMGECTGCQDAYGKTYEDVIDEFIVPLGKPLLTGLASGHGVYKAAVPIGAFVNLNADEGTLTWLEPAVTY